MDFILLFFVVMMSALVSPEFFRRFGIPYSTALIITGFVLGPSVLGGLYPDDVLQAMATMGILFLMFSAGLELKPEIMTQIGKKPIIISLFNGVIPFVGGYLLSRHLGLSIRTSLLLGILFISSSAGVVIPVLRELNLIKKPVGRTIISSVVIQDMASLIILTAYLRKFVSPGDISLPLYFLLVLIFILSLLIIIPKVAKNYFDTVDRRDKFEKKIRFTIIALMLITILAEFLHLHLIISAFIVGIAFASVMDRDLEEKINTVAYSFFIPVFFILLGMEMNPNVVLESREGLFLCIYIIAGLVTLKMVSGFIGALLSGFGIFDSLIIGASTTPQLSTTLAAAQIGHQAGILDNLLLTSVIILSVFTTIFAPICVSYLQRKKIAVEDFLLYTRPVTHRMKGIR